MENEREKLLISIARELSDTVRLKGVTLHEAEVIYNRALQLTRESPGLSELYEQWKNALIK